MEQKIDNIYRTYKDNDRIDDVLFEAYEFILSKLDDELLEDVWLTISIAINEALWQRIKK